MLHIVYQITNVYSTIPNAIIIFVYFLKILYSNLKKCIIVFKYFYFIDIKKVTTGLVIKEIKKMNYGGVD